MLPHASRAALATALILGLGATACGAEKAATATVSKSLTECRDQWHDVARSIVGLDEDTNPSALATRWTSVLATVDYYESTDTSENCQRSIENQLQAITDLRQFSTRLQPYDMEYQADLVTPDVGRYLADPLPAPVKDKKGKPVKPPSKAAITAALARLTDNAAAANEELKPGWAQLASVELTDDTAVTTALQDLAFLAKDSPNWVACNTALALIETAIRAQKGLEPNDPLPGQATPTPTTTPSSTPSSTPTTTPTTTPSTTTPTASPTS